MLHNLCQWTKQDTVKTEFQCVLWVASHYMAMEHSWSYIYFIEFQFLLDSVYVRARARARVQCTRVYPKVSGLVAWSENCKWQISLSLGAVASLFCEPVWWVLPPQPLVLLLNECLFLLFISLWLSPETFGYTLVLVSVKTSPETQVETYTFQNAVQFRRFSRFVIKCSY
jgi:hypothetical protein